MPESLFIEKETPAQVFSWEICTGFYITHLVTASNVWFYIVNILLILKDTAIEFPKLSALLVFLIFNPIIGE